MLIFNVDFDRTLRYTTGGSIFKIYANACSGACVRTYSQFPVLKRRRLPYASNVHFYQPITASRIHLPRVTISPMKDAFSGNAGTLRRFLPIPGLNSRFFCIMRRSPAFDFVAIRNLFAAPGPISISSTSPSLRVLSLRTVHSHNENSKNGHAALSIWRFLSATMIR